MTSSDDATVCAADASRRRPPSIQMPLTFDARALRAAFTLRLSSDHDYEFYRRSRDASGEWPADRPSRRPQYWEVRGHWRLMPRLAAEAPRSPSRRLAGQMT